MTRISRKKHDKSIPAQIYGRLNQISNLRLALDRKPIVVTATTKIPYKTGSVSKSFWDIIFYYF